MAARNDTATVCAMAILAMIAATAAHEAIGHGGACLLAGGQVTRLTSVYFHCSRDNGWASAGGPLGNLGAALLGWLGLRLLPSGAIRARLLAFLLWAFSLFWFAGYLVYDMAFGGGDYIFTARALFGGADVRPAAGAVGVVLYLFVARSIAAKARALAFASFLRPAWIAASVAAVAAALAYAPARLDAAIQAALEIGAASLPLLLARPAPGGAVIARSPTWIAAAVILFAAFALTLGRGIG
jgi:hypothetical protein